jgi:hypothetical protein
VPMGPSPERELSTVDLVNRAVEEARLLARAEILHAKEELKAELRSALVGGALFGAAGALALCALSVLFVAVALALPWRHVLACVAVGVVLLAAAATSAGVGFRRFPRTPMQRTRHGLRSSLAVMREHLP